MDFLDELVEAVLDLLFEGIVALSKNQKVPKVIRYALIVLITLFFITVIAIILIAGILSFKDFPVLGIIIMLFAIVMLIFAVIKLRKIYFDKYK